MAKGRGEGGWRGAGGPWLAAVALLPLAGGIGAQEIPSSWTAPVPPFRIAEGVWYVGTEELASYLFTSDDGHVLLDVPLEENVDLIEAAIRQAGFDPGDVRTIVASQAHFDHVGGIATFVERHGSSVALSAADAEMAARGGVGPGADRPAYRPFRADRILGHLDRVRVGDVELVAHLTPGHTPGCTSWGGRATLAGEPLEWISLCSLGVLPGYRLVGPEPTYPGIGVDFCRSVAYLRRLEPQVFLGAHASFFALASKRAAIDAGDSSVLVDRDRYRRYLDGNAARIDSVLVAQGEPAGCAGLLAASDEADRDAIAAASRAFSDAYVRGDTAALRDLYTPDAVLLPPGRTVRGRDAIARYFAPGPGRSNLTHAMTSSSLRIDGDVAVDVGTWSNRWRVGDGPPSYAEERYVVAWRRGTDGRWRIEVDMWHRPEG